jgi:hypothetical protein
MTQADAYIPPPAKTMDDIDKVIAFIKARVTPLRCAPYPSDAERAYQALLDLTAVLKGAAQSEITRGDDPSMPHFYLTIAARQWSDHPDFLPEWRS